MAPFHTLINLNGRGRLPPNRQIILSKCALFITFANLVYLCPTWRLTNYSFGMSLSQQKKKQIALEFHNAQPFALHKTSFCLRNCRLLPSNSWLMMVGYKIPPTVGPQSFDKWVLSDLIECKNASTCEIGLSGRPGGLSGFSNGQSVRIPQHIHNPSNPSKAQLPI